jgi:hypothetical protein
MPGRFIRLHISQGLSGVWLLLEETVMRVFLSACLLIAFGLLGSSHQAAASEGFDEIVKLAKGGLSEEVLLVYVQASDVPYNLNVDEIIYLKDVGVTSKVIAEMVTRGKALRTEAAQKGDPVAKGNPAPGDVPVAKDDPLPEDRGPDVPLPPQDPVVEKDPLPPPAEGDPQPPVIGRPQPEVAVEDKLPPVEDTRIRPDAFERNDGREVEPPVRETPREKEIVYVDRPVVETVVVESPTVVYAPPPERENISYFYESLSPYGTWVSIDGEWFWQPAVAVADREWRPYCDRGTWVSTDCGWAWHSEYSWGWAPFHYGRWTNHGRYGWVWEPDNVWGPAWVSWRSDDHHYGWAPLPAHSRYVEGVGFSFHGKNVDINFTFGLVERDYYFVNAEHFCEPELHHHRLPHDRVTNVYNNTTIIQNNYTYNDNRVINKGPSVDRVRQQTKREIRQMKIADAKIKQGERIKGNSIQNDTMVAYRPKLKAEAPEAPPAVIARKEAAIKRQQEAKATADARKDTREAKKDEREAVTDERRKQQQAEQQAAAQKRAAEAAAKEKARKDTAEKRDDSADQRKAEAAAREKARLEAAAREKARLEAAAREQALDAQRKTEAAAKEKARKDAAAEKRDDSADQRKAEAAAREKARLEAAARDQALDAQRKAEAAAREKARRDAAARENEAEQQQRIKAAEEAAARAAAAEEARRVKAAEAAAAREKARQERAGTGEAAQPLVQPGTTPAEADPATNDRAAQRKAEAEARRQAEAEAAAARKAEREAKKDAREEKRDNKKKKTESTDEMNGR